MSDSTGQPERIAEILREIISLSGTKGADDADIKSSHTVGMGNTQPSKIGHQKLEVMNQKLIKTQRDDRIDL
jgi:hypothetical protein